MKLFSKIVSIVLILSMLAALAIFPTQAEEFVDGSTAPEGSGTEADPYLIDSAEDLAWMSAQIGDGSYTEGVQSNPFAGKFFKQVCDVDLGGKTLRPIGYGHQGLRRGAPANTTYYVFGGVYDGQGYSIKNGTVRDWERVYSDFYKETVSSGLFGAICNATIKNVVMDNIDVYGTYNVGGLVGMASRDTKVNNSTPQERSVVYNNIFNCVLTDTCTLNTTMMSQAMGMAGSIAAFAIGTNISYCVSEATLNMSPATTLGGGMVGRVGYGFVMDHCVFKGSMVINNSNTGVAYNSFAGLVGGWLDHINGANGSITLKYSYADCSVKFLNQIRSVAGLDGLYQYSWAGIVDWCCNVQPAGPYLIDHCYSLTDDFSIKVDNAALSSFRAGALLGYNVYNNNTRQMGYVNVKDCYAVEMPSPLSLVTTGQLDGKLDHLWSLNNELCNSKVNKYAIDCGYDGCHTLGPCDHNGYLTAEEIRTNYTNDIDEEILNRLTFHSTGVNYVGVQDTDVENSTFDIRLVGTVDSLNYRKIGFDVYLNGGEYANDLGCLEVYNSLNESKNGEVTDVNTAYSFGSRYLYAYSLYNVPATGTWTFEVHPYSIALDSTEKVYSDAYLITYTDGAWVSTTPVTQ